MAIEADRLERFVEAQAGVYPQALEELRAGRKRSHWMWFVFPQMRGLGMSPTSLHYGIGSLTEARAYLDHPLLGERLRECVSAVLAHPDRSAEAIFGEVDAMKLRSSMTLFERAGGEPALVACCLDLFFGGVRDEATLRLLHPAD